MLLAGGPQLLRTDLQQMLLPMLQDWERDSAPPKPQCVPKQHVSLRENFHNDKGIEVRSMDRRELVK